MFENIIFCTLLIISPFLRIKGEFTFEDWTLKLGDQKLMKSVNYPDHAPYDLRQVWTIRSSPNTMVEIVCEDFEIPKKLPCGDYFLIINEGIEERFCGTQPGFKFLSKSGLMITLSTDAYSTGRLRCTATGVKSEEINDKWSYLDIISEEIDSSEHGGPRGQSSTTCECGWANKDQKRIFNGEEAKINEFPFVAGLMYEYQKFMFCGASIISPYHALTAAHCVHKKNDQLEIVVGEHNRLSDSETNATAYIKVKKYIQHPEYTWEGQMNDIAILLLETKIQFNKFVGPVCLPTGPINLDYRYVKVIGWGGNSITSSMSPFLQKLNVRVLPKPLCREIKGHKIPEGSPNQLCVHRNNKSSCFGDSGGPLVWIDPDTNRYTQVALVSYGSMQCGDYLPHVTTDVRSYMNWIMKVMRETNPDATPCWKVL